MLSAKRRAVFNNVTGEVEEGKRGGRGGWKGEISTGAEQEYITLGLPSSTIRGLNRCLLSMN